MEFATRTVPLAAGSSVALEKTSRESFSWSFGGGWYGEGPDLGHCRTGEAGRLLAAVWFAEAVERRRFRELFRPILSHRINKPWVSDTLESGKEPL